MQIYFWELGKLQPTITSTIFKLVEEAGELSREVMRFRPYLNSRGNLEPAGTTMLNSLIGELLDVGQTTATLAFCLNKTGEVDLGGVLEQHIKKLKQKRYVADATANLEIKDGKMILNLPRLDIDADIVWTCIKISEEAGELVQAAGKKAGMSGEKNPLTRAEIMKAIALELLDVAQCCVTMLYVLTEKYGIDIAVLLDAHAEKLREHGYL